MRAGASTALFWSFSLVFAPRAIACEPRDYQVYFDSGAAKFGARADDMDAVIHQFAAWIAASNADKPYVIVEGHTDTAEAPGSRLRLAERRAQYVMNRLVKAGVPRSIISVVSRGDQSLAVNSGEHVHDVLNRRVVLIGNGPAGC